MTLAGASALALCLLASACVELPTNYAVRTREDAIRIAKAACDADDAEKYFLGRWHARWSRTGWLVWYARGDFSFQTYTYAVGVDAETGEADNCVLRTD